MKFVYKAILQNIFSLLPNGENINYFFQKYVTKGLPVSDSEFEIKTATAKKHYDNYLKYSADINSDPIFYEFGAGWDLIIPLSYYTMGVNQQKLVDVRNNLKVELINNTARRLAGSFNNSKTMPPISNLEELKDKYGICAHIPADARKTGFPDNYFDFISNTDTLEHIPADELKKILAECRRILKKGGIVSCMIDMVDHYSYFDRSIPKFNFYKYTSSEWKKYNPAVHYQNRLRSIDYCEIAEEAGFTIIAKEEKFADDSEMKRLADLKITAGFDKYELKDLSTERLLLVLKK